MCFHSLDSCHVQMIVSGDMEGVGLDGVMSDGLCDGRGTVDGAAEEAGCGKT